MALLRHATPPQHRTHVPRRRGVCYFAYVFRYGPSWRDFLVFTPPSGRRHGKLDSNFRGAWRIIVFRGNPNHTGKSAKKSNKTTTLLAFFACLEEQNRAAKTSPVLRLKTLNSNFCVLEPQNLSSFDGTGSGGGGYFSRTA